MVWDLWDPFDVKRCEKICCPGMIKQAREPEGIIWMFCCIPLRTCVFLNCLCTVITCVFLTIAHKLFHLDFLTFTGGYALQSRVIISVIEVVGILAGLLGLYGTLTLRVHYVEFFQYYQMVRLAACFLMYITDVPLLLHCELFRTDLHKAIEEYDWNPVVFDLAINNHCSEERTTFVIASSIYLLVFMYLTSGTYDFLRELEDEPRYLLRVPKGRASGAFSATTLASRTLSKKAADMERRLEREAEFLAANGGGLVGAPIHTMGPLPERLPSFGAPQTVLQPAPMGSIMGVPGTAGPMGTYRGPGTRAALDMRL